MKLTLKHFVLKGESKRLYRNFMKLTRRIDDKQQAKDMRLWIRDDFKINKHLIDENDIRSQHIRAKTAYDELETSIELSRAKVDK